MSRASTVRIPLLEAIIRCISMNGTDRGVGHISGTPLSWLSSVSRDSLQERHQCLVSGLLVGHSGRQHIREELVYLSMGNLSIKNPSMENPSISLSILRIARSLALLEINTSHLSSKFVIYPLTHPLIIPIPQESILKPWH